LVCGGGYNMKTLIKILGPAYCGSSYTGTVLGALDKVSFIGESSWLTGNKDAYWKETIGRDLINGGSIKDGTPCRVCVAKKRICNIYTPENILRARRNIKNWFAEWAEILEADVVISGDKIPEIFNGIDGGVKIKTLVMFRSPESQIGSLIKHGLLTGKYGIASSDSDPTAVAIDYYLRLYTRILALRDHNFHFVDFENLVANKNKWNILCNHLGLQWRINARNYWQYDQHIIGGNERAIKGYIHKSNMENDIDIANEWKEHLRRVDLIKVRNNKDINIIYSKLIAGSIL
jgi:hypothetical protein